MSLLKQIITIKRQINKLLKLKLKLDIKVNIKYKIKIINNSAIYITKTIYQVLRLYYLISWKDYLEDKNTLDPASAIMYLQKIANNFHKNHPKKLPTTSSLIDSISLMTKPLA